MISMLIKEALTAVGEIVTPEKVVVVIARVMKCRKQIKEWLEKNVKKNLTENSTEIPAEILEGIQEIAQRYVERPKCPVYMDGVIFFFHKELDDETKQTLRELIEVTGLEDHSRSEDECTVYEFVSQYMGGDTVENYDFGFEHNTLYLNFTQKDDMSDRLYNEADIRECADALNQFLEDNEIESFVTF